ncbi:MULTISPECIES: hypothetical protein [Dickeya]|uniref:Uncharacterized protein n=1 Tax=Dickeya aquatica TaxID=1401087 RepID=A0A375AEN1_9GAMM|nr:MULTISPECIES: hypothetical protein [Dickeya]SLM64543.1 hypothetical protein DAQ1742_03749 [Dickeya aquatica]
MTIEIRQLTIYANVTHSGNAPENVADEAAPPLPAAIGQDNQPVPLVNDTAHQTQAQPRER